MPFLTLYKPTTKRQKRIGLWTLGGFSLFSLYFLKIFLANRFFIFEETWNMPVCFFVLSFPSILKILSLTGIFCLALKDSSVYILLRILGLCAVILCSKHFLLSWVALEFFYLQTKSKMSGAFPFRHSCWLAAQAMYALCIFTKSPSWEIPQAPTDFPLIPILLWLYPWPKDFLKNNSTLTALCSGPLIWVLATHYPMTFGPHAVTLWTLSLVCLSFYKKDFYNAQAWTGVNGLMLLCAPPCVQWLFVLFSGLMVLGWHRYRHQKNIKIFYGLMGLGFFSAGHALYFLPQPWNLISFLFAVFLCTHALCHVKKF